MVTIAICDDDQFILEHISGLLKQCMPLDSKIARFDSGDSFWEYLNNAVRGNLDIVLMDIDLKKENGIELSRKLKHYFPWIKIIFITGYIDYSQSIFEADPTYFLVKPIQKEKLQIALETAITAIENENLQSISFASKGMVLNLPLRKIRYFESLKRVTIVHEGNGRREVYIKLDEIEKKLPRSFLRCHKSFIVNMDRIHSLNMHRFILNEGEEIPISQSKYKEAKMRFLEYLGDSL